MSAHLSEQDFIAAFEKGPEALSVTLQQHLKVCEHCQEELAEQLEVDNALLALEPQKLDLLKSREIIKNLIIPQSKTGYLKYLFPAVMLLFFLFLILNSVMNGAPQPTELSWDNTLNKISNIADQIQQIPKSISNLKSPAELLDKMKIMAQPNTLKIFFALVVLGFYAVLDQRIRGRFFH